MMMNLPPLGAVVELRQGLERFYNGAKPGWRGIVKDHKEDEGFDLIYVEWDRSYWRYDDTTQQPDGWTYPAHFEVIGQLSTTPEQFAADVMAEADDQADDVCPTCGVVHTDEDRYAAYLDLLSHAANEAADGEAFALFFVQRTEDGDEVLIRPYMISASLTDEGQALIEAQMVKSAQSHMDKFMLEYLRKMQ